MTYKIASYSILPTMATFGEATPCSGEGRWRPNLPDNHGVGSSGQRLVRQERCPGGCLGTRLGGLWETGVTLVAMARLSLARLEAEGAKSSILGSQVLLVLSPVKDREMCFRLHQDSSERLWDVL
jgi:hypothetical protein